MVFPSSFIDLWVWFSLILTFTHNVLPLITASHQPVKCAKLMFCLSFLVSSFKVKHEHRPSEIVVKVLLQYMIAFVLVPHTWMVPALMTMIYFFIKLLHWERKKDSVSRQLQRASNVERWTNTRSCMKNKEKMIKIFGWLCM